MGTRADESGFSSEAVSCGAALECGQTPDKAVIAMRMRNNYNNPFENVVPRASGQPQTEDSKERERAFSDRAVLIEKLKLSRLNTDLKKAPREV